MADAVLRVLIADDEPPARALLRHLVVHLGAVVVGEAADGAEAVMLTRDHRPDIALLDIAMPGVGGMEAARELARLAAPPAVIFCTAYEGYALAAFEVAAVDYLLKPVDEGRLAEALERAARTRSAPPPLHVEHIWIPYRSELLRVETAVIERVEAERDYVRLCIGGRTYLLRATMNEMEGRLDRSRFIRLHRSTIVRRDLISGLRHEGGGVWCAILTDGHETRIGRNYLHAARALAE